MEIVSKGAYALKHLVYVGIKKYFSVKSSLALQTARGLCMLSVVTPVLAQVVLVLSPSWYPPSRGVLLS